MCELRTACAAGQAVVHSATGSAANTHAHTHRYTHTLQLSCTGIKTTYTKALITQTHLSYTHTTYTHTITLINKNRDMFIDSLSLSLSLSHTHTLHRQNTEPERLSDKRSGHTRKRSLMGYGAEAAGSSPSS